MCWCIERIESGRQGEVVFAFRLFDHSLKCTKFSAGRRDLAVFMDTGTDGKQDRREEDDDRDGDEDFDEGETSRWSGERLWEGVSHECIHLINRRRR